MARFFFSGSGNEPETRKKLLFQDWSPDERLFRRGKANQNELELLEKIITQEKDAALQAGVDKNEQT